MSTSRFDEGKETARPQLQEASDKSLCRHVRAGCQEAAAALYARYEKRLRDVARQRHARELSPRLDPDDIVQSVFRSFFDAARRGFYSAPTGEELWKILVVITLNKVRRQISHHRAAKRDVRLTRAIDEKQLETSMGGRFDQVFLEMTVQEALDALPPLSRQIAELRLEGREMAEIAETVGRSKRTVERTLHGLRDHLKDFFDARE
jgi:RNA polymerase sigma-70 factor, ECF subfamily